MYYWLNFISILFQTSSVSLSKLHFHTFPNLICIFVLISLPYFSKPHLYLQRWKGRRDQVGLQLCQPKFLLCGPPPMSAKDWWWLLWNYILLMNTPTCLSSYHQSSPRPFLATLGPSPRLSTTSWTTWKRYAGERVLNEYYISQVFNNLMDHLNA